ncbi:LysR family transcriptional regulator [Pseudomonas sp. NPDC087697]|uniref:LysR family transcriptional regulator n=1 Tax=Pseudomonas sp. NPDC087697 TaxID=3364447 RepID=UPI003807DF09
MDTIDALRIFVSIDKSGSLSGAARQHSLATSTVSGALQQLEQNAGVRLITRSTRRLSFTHEGRQFLCEARKILAVWDATLEGVKEGPLTGLIRFTTTQDFGSEVVAPLIDSFLELHPGIRFDLLLAEDVLDLVQNHLDFALRHGPLSDSSLRARLLVSGRRVISAAPTYWAAHGKPTCPQDLPRHNCLVISRPDRSFSTWSFTEGGKRLRVKVSGNRMANNGGVLRQWAIKGYGVVMSPLWNIRKELQAGVLSTALEGFLPDEANLYAVTAEGVASRRVTAFLDFLARELAGFA